MTANHSSEWKLTRLFHINVTCSNLDRSVAFYNVLGFEVRGDYFTEQPYEELYKLAMPAIGMKPDVKHRACAMYVPGTDVPYLDLIEWIEPRTQAGPTIVGNSPGIPRIALEVEDLKTAVSELTEQGVEFHGDPVGPMKELGVEWMAFTRDPDGLLIELVEFVKQ